MTLENLERLLPGEPTLKVPGIERAVRDNMLSEEVVNQAIRWFETINSRTASEAEIIRAEYGLAQATERLHEHRS